MEAQWINFGILIVVSIGGGLIGSSLSKTTNSNLLSAFLPFSGAFLLGILVLHMAPIVYRGEEHHVIYGGFIIAGFLIQLFLERFTQGLEHGHLHIHHQNAARFAMFVMIGLCIHAFIEGLPLVHSEHNHTDQNYLYALVLHKFPAALTLGILFKLSQISTVRFYAYLILFSIMTPVGGLFGEFVLREPEHIRYATALVLGSFLHISTTIIFESDKDKDHRISLRKLSAIIIGLAGAYISVILA
jgi:zinc transporter ZupT